MIEISYITVTEVIDDELPIRIEAYVPGNDLCPRFYGAGQTLDGALERIRNFTGQSLEYLRNKVYN